MERVSMSVGGPGDRRKDTPEQPAVHQQVLALGGFAIGVGHGDLHVFGDGRPLYTLEIARDRPTPPRSWLRELPSRLLDPHHSIVPFEGRQEELGFFDAWRRAPDRLSVVFLHGAVGQGKTRLAMRVAAEFQAHGWKVVLARHGGDTITAPDSSQDLSGTVSGLLLVADYADRWPYAHLSWLLRNRLLHSAVPTRVLLVARSVVGWPAIQHDLEEVYAATGDLALGPLASTLEDRRSIFNSAVLSFAEVLRTSPPDLSRVDLTDPAFASVLSLHMAALVSVDARLPLGEHLTSDRLSAYLLRREKAHWARLHSRSSESGEFSTDPSDLAKVAFIATLRGTQPESTAVPLISSYLPYCDPSILDDHAICYPPSAAGTYLEPLIPDRLAEDYVALTLPGHSVTGYAADLWAGDTVSPIVRSSGVPDFSHGHRPLIYLLAAAQRWTHVAARWLIPLVREEPALLADAGSAALAAFADVASGESEVLESVLSAVPSERHDLFPAIAVLVERLTPSRLAVASDSGEEAEVLLLLGHALGRAGRDLDALMPLKGAVERLHALVYGGVAGYDETYAECMLTLTTAMSNLGRFPSAVQSSIEAVGVLGRLAEKDPYLYLRHLASALVSAASALSKVGDKDRAVTCAEEALTYLELYADSEPGIVAQRAETLSDLATSYLGVGRALDAEETASRAVALAQSLAAGEPTDTAIQVSIAQTLNVQAAALFAVGRYREASDRAAESVAIRRDLVQVNERVYMSQLANALSGLGNYLDFAGDPAGALAVTQEAFAIYQQIAPLNPQLLVPALARVRGELARRLLELDDLDSSLEHAAVAVRMSERLADLDRGSADAQPRAWTTLGSVHLRAGRFRNALAALEAAKTQFARLAEAEPAVYGVDYALSFLNIANTHYAAGDRDAAWAAAEAAVEQLRTVENRVPGAYRWLLARALSLLADLRAGDGDPQPIIEILDEVIRAIRTSGADGAQLAPDIARALRTRHQLLSETSDVDGAAEAELFTVFAQRPPASDDAAASANALALAEEAMARVRQGDITAALRMSAEAEDASRQLAQANPPHVLPAFAKILFLFASIRVFALVDLDAADRANQEAGAVFELLGEWGQNGYVEDLDRCKVQTWILGLLAEGLSPAEIRAEASTDVLAARWSADQLPPEA
ncbi:hypothetical protein [Planotetraspora sp. GP83]|uniref:tetratricopeptide repeat protein n=1 Tax=Planotetraspora sp. GP83 TaxID=3156264 RepID=UPI00351447E7